MVRPNKCRLVHAKPGATYFKPRGVPLSTLEEAAVTVEEFEALRLCDLEGLGQVEVAKKMGISQSTLNRVLRSARKKIAGALANGNAIKIEGGSYKLKR